MKRQLEVYTSEVGMLRTSLQSVRGWLLRWESKGAGKNIMGEEVDFSVPPNELRAAIAGKAPPQKRTRGSKR